MLYKWLLKKQGGVEMIIHTGFHEDEIRLYYQQDYRRAVMKKKMPRHSISIWFYYSKEPTFYNPGKPSIHLRISHCPQALIP